jgi:tRNA threonylcarbamoyladenosine biosynthesis protein TsaE
VILQLPDAAATEALGARLAQSLVPAIVYLQGDLGTGKTTLTRGLLRGLGHEGRVRSPTYTLVEPYRFAGGVIYHLDLYRLADPEELEWLGLRDMLAEHALLLVEWPERGAGVLPPADLIITLEYSGSGRRVTLDAASAAGEQLLENVRMP